MNAFVANISSFPTLIYTIFLGLFCLYWIVASLGLLDIDILDFDTEFDVDNSGINFTGLLMKLKLDGIPTTIVFTFITLFGWLLSYFTVYLFWSFIPPGWLSALIGCLTIVVAFILACPITSIFINPLKTLFRKTSATGKHDLVGRTVTLRTGEVNEEFGEARLDDGGAGLILKVRADSPNQLVRGDKLVLLKYQATDNAYLVISEADFLKP